MNAVPQPYKGLGGWLILFAIGLFITPLRLAFAVFNDLLPLYKRETWDALTMAGSESYHPFWKSLILFETIGNLIFIAFSIILLVLFFLRKRAFPKLAIVMMGSSCLFVGIDYVFAQQITFIAQQNDPQAMSSIVQTFIRSLIWIPYMIVSKRVKATFTE